MYCKSFSENSNINNSPVDRYPCNLERITKIQQQIICHIVHKLVSLLAGTAAEKTINYAVQDQCNFQLSGKTGNGCRTLEILHGKNETMIIMVIIIWLYNYGNNYAQFFYKQLHFKSKPGVDSEILENEAESCFAVAYQKIDKSAFKRNRCFQENCLIFAKSQAGSCLGSCGVD